MYLWNVDALVKDFQNNHVSSAEEFKYFMLYNIAMILCTSSLVTDGATLNTESLIETIGSLIIFALGIYKTYQINQSGDNHSFMSRSICLSIPIGLRLCLFGFIVFIPIGILLNEIPYVLTMSIWLVEIGYFYYFCQKIKQIAHHHPIEHTL
jgi:hypothetical protein